MKIQSGDAIKSLRPNSEFVCSETKEGVRTINWLDSSTTQPSDSEIDAEMSLRGMLRPAKNTCSANR